MIYQISREILNILIRIFFKLKINNAGKIPDAPYIAISNHSSYIDPPILGMACRKDRISFMAKKELFDLFIIGSWFRAVGAIEVARGKSSVKSIKQALVKIKEGTSVALFPEGTRSEDGEIQEAKRGVGFLVSKAAVPVVPIYIKGTNKALSKKGKVKFKEQIDIFVGDPISPEEINSLSGGGKGYGRISEILMERVKEIAEREGKI